MENFYKALIIAVEEIAAKMDRAAIDNPNMARHYRYLAKHARKDAVLYHGHLATLKVA